MRKLARLTAIGVVAVVLLMVPVAEAVAYVGTSSTWRFQNDYTGVAGRQQYPEGWRRHKDGTLPGAGLYSVPGVTYQPVKANNYFKVVSGTNAGNRYMTKYTRTGKRYYLKVKQLAGWQNSMTGFGFDFTTSSGQTISYSSSVGTAVTGSVNASYAGLGASVDATAKTSRAFKQTVSTNTTTTYKKALSVFDQHSTVRLAPYYYQRFELYAAQTYQYRSSTGKYDLPVTYVNGKKVSGPYLGASTYPCIEFCWGVSS